MKKLIWAIVFTVVLAVFALSAFPYLYKNAHADILGKELEQRASNRFSGVITVWQVDSFEGGVGSRTAWLNTSLSKLEKSYNGVYFSVKSVSPELLPKLLEQSKPDIISFGHGVFSLEQVQSQFIKLETETDGLIPSLVKSGEGYALPLFFGGYCMLTGNEHIRSGYPDDLAGFLASDFGSITYNKRKVEVYPLAAGSYNTSLAALALSVPDGALDLKHYLCNADALWDHYNYNKLSASALVSQRQLYRLSAASEKGNGRQSAVLPLYPYTDMVQYIAVFKGASEPKQKVINRVLSYLTDTQVQLTLNTIGIMPANIAALQGIKYENQHMQTMCDHYKDKNIVTPSPYISLDKVNDWALEYLSGNSIDFDTYTNSLYR